MLVNIYKYYTFNDKFVDYILSLSEEDYDGYEFMCTAECEFTNKDIFESVENEITIGDVCYVDHINKKVKILNINI